MFVSIIVIIVACWAHCIILSGWEGTDVRVLVFSITESLKSLEYWFREYLNAILLYFQIQTSSVVILTALIKMELMEILYWRDVRVTGVIFLSCMLLLTSFNHFTVVTVVTYLLMLALVPPLIYRLAVSLKCAVLKTDCEHPFRWDKIKI